MGSEQGEEPASAARFHGLAEVYARCRPSYPTAAIDFIIERCGLKPGSVLVDVGSGTGISSRLFAARGLDVIGIEPNAEMRAHAEEANSSDAAMKPIYQAGNADATGLPGENAQAVVSAQAFHWFDPGTTLPEFQRLLKPGGWVVLLWNERAVRDAFTADVSRLVRALPDWDQVEGKRPHHGDVLLKSELFPNALRTVFPSQQELDEEGLLGRIFSMSFTPQEGEPAEQVARELTEIFQRHQRDGQVVLQYDTMVYLGQRD